MRPTQYQLQTWAKKNNNSILTVLEINKEASRKINAAKQNFEQDNYTLLPSMNIETLFPNVSSEQITINIHIKELGHSPYSVLSKIFTTIHKRIIKTETKTIEKEFRFLEGLEDQSLIEELLIDQTHNLIHNLQRKAAFQISDAFNVLEDETKGELAPETVEFFRNLEKRLIVKSSEFSSTFEREINHGYINFLAERDEKITKSSVEILNSLSNQYNFLIRVDVLQKSLLDEVKQIFDIILSQCNPELSFCLYLTRFTQNSPEYESGTFLRYSDEHIYDQSPFSRILPKLFAAALEHISLPQESSSKESILESYVNFITGLPFWITQNALKWVQEGKLPSYKTKLRPEECKALILSIEKFYSLEQNSIISLKLMIDEYEGNLKHLYTALEMLEYYTTLQGIFYPQEYIGSLIRRLKDEQSTRNPRKTAERLLTELISSEVILKCSNGSLVTFILSSALIEALEYLQIRIRSISEMEQQEESLILIY
ncbi:MAG: hypothetical protein ACFFCZ_24440 [Promethearchaeota archaeon]